MKKSLLIPILTVLVVGGVGLTAASAVQADDTSSTHTEFVSRLAERFGLNATEVQTFMQEEWGTRHEIRKGEMQTRLEERLSQAVAEGSITEEQKQLLLTKHAELQQDREATRPEPGAMQNMTQEEREAEREKRRSEHESHRATLQAWASENGIDLQLLLPEKSRNEQGFGGRRGGHGPGML